MTEFWFDPEQTKIVTASELNPDEKVPDSLMPLRDLLENDEFPFQTGDFHRVDRTEWGERQCVEVGKLALAAIEEADGQPPITTRHIARLAILGQVPGIDVFNKHFGTFYNFKKKIGSPILYDRVKYARWGVADFSRYASGIIEDLGYLPERQDYDRLFRDGKGPSFSLIEDHVGGIKTLHDMLGYPSTTEWIKDDFVDWGIKVMTANTDKAFSLYLVQALTSKRRGPSHFTIYAKYGSWSEFRSDVEKDYNELTESRHIEKTKKLSRYRDSIKNDSLPKSYDQLEDAVLLAAAARHQVAKDLLLDAESDLVEGVSGKESDGFLTRLRKIDPSLTVHQIETVAQSSGLFYDIWPVDDTYDYLYVPKEEVDEIKRTATRKKISYRRNSRTAQVI